MPDTLPLLFEGGVCKVKHTSCGKCRGRRLEEAAGVSRGADARYCRLPMPVAAPTNKLGCHLIERTERRFVVMTVTAMRNASRLNRRGSMRLALAALLTGAFSQSRQGSATVRVR